ncbi:MAG: tyrosine-type recombinase/integrase [Chloroflexi bacterium]|nr:tyrosine-type recombinase/integrase [Chloroflexota bacterium]
MQTALTTTSPLDLSALDRADLQPSTKARYRHEIEVMHAAGVNPSNYTALQQYADGLKSSRKQFLKSALRLMVQGIEQDMKANATPQNLKQTQAALLRLDAMKNAVQVNKPKGTKAHTWLSQKQVVHITSLCGDTLEGKRDWIVLGLLLGAGLRRDELVNLTFDAVKQQPTKSGKMRTVIEVTGKGDKSRVIPIQDKLADRLKEWREIAGGGYIARSLGRKQELGESLSAVAVFHLVNKYGRKIGMDELAPHDLRRTFAQLGYEAGIPLTQISTLLGHSSVATTQRYLNLALDLESTASDFINLA